MDLSALTEADLTALSVRARRRLAILEDGNLADLQVARFEVFPDASDRLFDRNFDLTSKMRTCIREIDEEMTRRAST